MNDELVQGLPEAAPWSLWAGQIGKGAIGAAIAFFALAIILWLVSSKKPALEKPGTASFILGCVSIFSAFGLLIALFVKDQFQYEYVWAHADSNTDLKYKIAGVWTAQQGSFLLWATATAISGLLALRGTGEYRRWYVATLSVILGSLAGILAYETPFNIIPQAIAHGKTFVSPTGNGMTPSLQNYWVVIHPPTIFMGFGSLAIPFALAVAAMATGNIKDWVKIVRPWALVTVGILGLGISMGGLWAYETQGWGGFWAWDPVENVSFVPWLFIVVLAHGVMVQVTKGRGAFGNLLMGGLTFLSFVYGTFLTRSGLLDNVSVHSFASMDNNARGVLKVFLIAASVGFAGLLFTRGRVLCKQLERPGEVASPGYSRESMLRAGMMLISMVTIVIALGMSWPVIAAVKGGQGSKVEEWLYHLVVVWFYIPIMLLMGVVPFISWNAESASSIWNKVSNTVMVTIGLTGFIQIGLMNRTYGVHVDPAATVAGPFGMKVPLVWWMLFLILVTVFTLVTNAARTIQLVKRSALGTGGFVAHFGMAVLLGGLIISRGFEREEQVFLRPGTSAQALDYTLTYKGRSNDDLFNRDNKVLIEVKSPTGETFTARPGLYLYGDPNEPKDMVWPHVERMPSHDIYLAMSPPEFKAWNEPLRMKPGESKTVNDVTVDYLKSTMKGQPGTAGVEFGAEVRVTTTDANNERHQYLANPTVKLSQGGLDPTIPEVGSDYRIAMVGGMNPADKSVELMLFFSPPIYPIKLFYKPMTGLVWLGTGILTIGGLMAAYARRRVTVSEKRPVGATNQDPKKPKDAPLPAT